MERLASCAATREFGVRCSARSKAATISSPRLGPVPFVVRPIVPSWRLSKSTFDATGGSAAMTSIHAARARRSCSAARRGEKLARTGARPGLPPGYVPCCLLSA